MKNSKFLRLTPLLFLVVIIVIFVINYAGYVNNAFGIFNRSVDTRIESWVDYKPTNKTLGRGICEDEQFGTILEKINSQPRSAIQFDGGLTLIATENPLRWRNSEFRDYYYFVLSKCRTTEGFIPVRAYPDKLLWKNDCSRFWQKAFILPCNDMQKKILAWENENAKSSNQEFNEAGIRFQTPPGYHHTLSSSPINDYRLFTFYPDGTLGGYSNITLFIPLESNLDIESIEKDLEMKITPPDSSVGKIVALDSVPGVATTERHTFAESPPYPWDGEYIYEYYRIRSSNAPVVLIYHHAYADDVMQPYWEMMHDTWRFDE